MLTRILRYYYYSGSTSQHHTYGLGIFIRRDIESIKISVKNVAPHSPINKKNRKLLQLKHSAANHSKKKNTTVHDDFNAKIDKRFGAYNLGVRNARRDR